MVGERNKTHIVDKFVISAYIKCKSNFGFACIYTLY